VRQLLDGVGVASFYMHPYDATDHHDLENGGEAFRRRVGRLFGQRTAGGSLVTASSTVETRQ
jgi:hypothetical protein